MQIAPRRSVEGDGGHPIHEEEWQEPAAQATELAGFGIYEKDRFYDPFAGFDTWNIGA